MGDDDARGVGHDIKKIRRVSYGMNFKIAVGLGQ